jgi:hypothetical protein
MDVKQAFQSMTQPDEAGSASDVADGTDSNHVAPDLR